MKIASSVVRYFLFIVLLSGCAGQAQSAPTETLAEHLTEVFLPEPKTTPVLSPTMNLFVDTDLEGATPTAPEIVRWRFVKLNLGVLLDEAGQYREIKEITINLFPDVVYTAVIRNFEQTGDGYTWGGYLKDTENSQMTMVYTSGVFVANFASPMGVYEVSIVGDDLYRVIQIDHAKFQGGEG